MSDQLWHLGYTVPACGDKAARVALTPNPQEVGCIRCLKVQYEALRLDWGRDLFDLTAAYVERDALTTERDRLAA